MGRRKRVVGKRRAPVPLSAFHNSADIGNPQKTSRQDLNPFEILQTIDDQEVTITTTARLPTKLPPPIVVASSNVGDVHKKIIAAGVVKYTTLVTNNGTLVRTTTSNDFRAVVNQLKTTNTDFHTYQLDEEKTTKVVLLGLTDMPIEEVTTILKNESVTPVAIKKLGIKQKRYDDQAAYLLHFKKGTVDMKLLRSITALEHQIVKWRYYSNSTSIMQCKNCQRFGHGAANCFRPPVCIKCAEPHGSTNCPAAKTSTDGILPTHKLKCANCGGNHTANFFGCPVRINKTAVKEKPKQTTSKQVPQLNGNFPHLPSKPTSQLFPSQPTSLPYASPTSFAQRTNFKPFANVTANKPDDLFNPDELVEIIKETFTCLRNCTNKEDQIMVVFKIVQKFCFP